MIRLVLFDADGVIQTTSPTWLPALKALSPTAEDADQLLADIFIAEKRCVTGAEPFAEALLPVLEHWNITVPATDVLNIWTMIEPLYDNLAVVSDVRAQGVTTGLATNQQEHRASYIRSELDYHHHFDHFFISCELGVAKPDPDYFRVIAENMALPVAEIAFIDDHPANVEAAQSAGVSAAVYDLATGAQGLRAALRAAGCSEDSL